MGPEEFDRKAYRREHRYAMDGSVFARGRRSKGSSVFMGAFLTLIGVALLLDNLGFLEFRDIWNYWPVLLIALGVSRLLASRRPASMIWGGLISTAGVLLLLRNLNILHFHIDGRLVGPLVLIGFGLMMLVRALERSQDKSADRSGEVVSDKTVSEFAVFTGCKRRVRSGSFLGGDLFAMFGGIDMDMRETVMGAPQANLDVQAMFGGVDLRIPETWIVDMRGIGMFGGWDDKTVPPRIEEGKPAPRLIVTGNAIFGGVVIRN